MIDLTDYGFDASLLSDNTPQNLCPARVIAEHRGQYQIVAPFGECSARLRGSVQKQLSLGGDESAYPTVGDFVLVEQNPLGDARIHAVLPRKTAFTRVRAFYAQTAATQALAANFDLALLMASLNQDLNLSRMERYLATAWQSGAQPVIVLTKADLAHDLAVVDSLAALAPGVPVLCISTLTGQGMDALRALLGRGKTAVLLGSSGVGKSTLVNCLMGEETMATQQIREADAHGRHTTTHRQLLRLPDGTMIIDTPGIRTLTLSDAEEGFDATFEDIENIYRQCRFADCTHSGEPGCAIQAALSSGELTRKRWENYKKLQREFKHAAKTQKKKAMQRQKKTAYRRGSNPDGQE